MSKMSGKFNTTTKTKISTPHGNILKLTYYDIDEECYSDYKIKPKCSICGGDVGCVCYNDDNSDDPLQSAIDSFQKEWCCEKPSCICNFMKNYNEDKYKELVKKYGDDELLISEILQEEFSDDGEDIFCNI